jgi:hypothetical protein
MKTWPDVASQLITAFEPYFPFLVGFVLFYGLARLHEQSMLGLLKGLFVEFRSLLDRKGGSLKSINAMGIILFVLLCVYLFFGGISHIVLPEKGDVPHVTDLTRGIYVVVLFIFAVVILFSIKLTKYQR